jgi:hypothetical protein
MPVKIEKDNSITISGFEGIGQSPLADFSDALGVNLDIPGVLGVGYKFNRIIETKSAINFAITTAGFDYFELATPDRTLHRAPVKLSTTGTLPTGLNTTDIYYLWDINNDGESFRFSESLKDVGGAFLNLSDQGTGTHSFTRITPGIVKGYTFDSYSNLYMLDDKQRVWFSQTSSNYQDLYLLEGNTSSGSGNGIIYYAGYILVFGNAKMDALLAINDVDATLTWTNDFVSDSLSSTAIYPRKGAVPFYSQYDNAVYFSNGTSVFNTSRVRVGLIEENVGKTFDPADTTTFSVVPDAIELSNLDSKGFVQSINEINDRLILGTQSNNVYFWDRKSILPYSVVNMPEQNTTGIFVKEGIIYAFCGYSGIIYQLGESYYNDIASIPEHLFDTKYTESTSYATLSFIDLIDSISVKDELLFSIEVSGKCYLMSYNTRTRKLIKKNISSYGETLTTGSQPGRIYKIISLDKTTITRNIFLSSKKEASPDTLAIESYYDDNVLKVLDDDSAYITTGLMSVGEVYNKKTFRQLSLSFLRELTTGQSIKIYYRRNDNGAWTLLKTIDYNTYGAIKDIKVDAVLSDVIDLQIKIVINGYNSTNYFGTSPLLKYLRLIP